MFYVWGIESIVLDTMSVAHPCAKCGHANQILSVYQKYLEVSCVFMIPLTKSCRVNCPHCGKVLKKKRFVAELQERGGIEARKIEDEMYARIRNAKMPVHAKVRFAVLVLLLVAFSGFMMYEDKQSTLRVQEYHAKPYSQVLLVRKDTTQQYPYDIVFVKAIKGKSAKILQSKHSYKRLSDAKQSAQSIQKSLGTATQFDAFEEPQIIKINDLLACSIVEVLPNA